MEGGKVLITTSWDVTKCLSGRDQTIYFSLELSTLTAASQSAFNPGAKVLCSESPTCAET